MSARIIILPVRIDRGAGVIPFCRRPRRGNRRAPQIPAAPAEVIDYEAAMAAVRSTMAERPK